MFKVLCFHWHPICQRYTYFSIQQCQASHCLKTAIYASTKPKQGAIFLFFILPFVTCCPFIPYTLFPTISFFALWSLHRNLSSRPFVQLTLEIIGLFWTRLDWRRYLSIWRRYGNHERPFLFCCYCKKELIFIYPSLWLDVHLQR